MIILSAFLTATDIILSKIYQNRNGDTLESGLKFNFFVGLFSSVIFLGINNFSISFSLISCVLAVVMTSMAIAFIIIGFSIMSSGQTAYYTFFRMTGAMLVPYIWGLFFLKEEFSVLRFLGLILIILSIFLINSDNYNISFKSTIMCICVFFLAGCVSIISKQHSINKRAVSPIDYVILTSFVKIILCGGLLLFYRKKEENKNQSNKSILIPCIFSAIVTGLAYMIQLICAEEIPASLLFPIITGGTIIFSAILVRIVCKEKLSKKGITSIALCFVGTCMFV